jgi:hypothetical protein
MKSPRALPVSRLSLLLVCCALLGCSSSAAPATSPPVDDAPIDAAMRAEVIDLALKKVAQHYLFPDVAAKMVAAVRAHQQHGDYDHTTSAVAFAELLSAHLFAIARDKHLSMRYWPAILPPDPAPGAPPDPAAQAAEAASARFSNNGFDRVERLDGNIGYLKFSRFVARWRVAETVAAAMTFIANADAFIVDLRENWGGFPDTVDLVESYFLDGATPAGASPPVAGRRLGKEKPLYVLTSAETISGGEAFAYELQALKRATIVGETTAGAAHFGPIFRLNDHFNMQIAVGQGVNPITKTNWEGTGVKPDVPVRADLALATAELLALQGRAEKAQDPEEKEEYRKAVLDAQAELERLKRAPRR